MLQKPLYSGQASFIRTFYPCDSLIGFGGGAVEADFNGLGRKTFEQADNRICNEGAVCENSDQDPFGSEIPIDVSKIAAHQGFAACQKQKQAACVGDLIDDRKEEFRIGFLMTLFPYSRLGADITVDASQIAPVGEVNAP